MNDETPEQRLVRIIYTLPVLDCERLWRVARTNCQFYRLAHNISERAIMMNVEKFFRLKFDAYRREAPDCSIHTYSRYCLNAHIDMQGARFNDATPSLIAFVLIARHNNHKRLPPINMTVTLHGVPEAVPDVYRSRQIACLHAMTIMVNHVRRMRRASENAARDNDHDESECSYADTTLMIGENRFEFRTDVPHAIEN